MNSRFKTQLNRVETLIAQERALAKKKRRKKKTKRSRSTRSAGHVSGSSSTHSSLEESDPDGGRDGTQDEPTDCPEMKPRLILLHQPVQQLPRRLALLLSSLLPLNLQEQNRRHPSLHVVNIRLEHGKLTKPEHSFRCSVCWERLKPLTQSLSRYSLNLS